MKKTSVLLEPAFYRACKQTALDRGIPLTELIRIALQAEIDRKPTKRSAVAK